MKKKMISLLLVLALAVGICPAAFAAEETKSSTILSSKEESNNLLRYGEREVIEVVETATKSVETTPTGQPSGGYSFPSYGGSVYIQTSGGGEISVGLYTFNHNPYWMAWGVIDDSITEVTISNQHCNIIVAKNAKIFYCIDQPGSIPATDNYKLYRHRNSSSVKPGHGVIVPELLNT